MEMDANEFDYGGMSVSRPGAAAKSIILVGNAGDGKSATGNSILGRKAFKSVVRTTVVTRTSETQTTLMENGQTLAVIDTPGWLDYSADPEFIHNEMLKCIKMAKDGIHAILLVMSIRTHFPREEEDGVSMLQNMFGPGIMSYMIVVFTGGDEFEEEYGKRLDYYLSDSDCPDPLKETLRMCGNRRVLFNNKTKDEAETSEQLKQLYALLNEVADKNGGKPYTHTVVDTNEGKPYKHDVVVGTIGGKLYKHDTDVGTIGRKPYKHDAVVGTTGEKQYPYDGVVGTFDGFTKISKPEKEGSVFLSSHNVTSDISAYKGATNKPHARTAEVSSSKKEDDIFEPHVKKVYEGQLENARLQAEIDILRDQMEFKDQTHKLHMDIEIAKRKKYKNLESRDGPLTRIKSTVLHVISQQLTPPSPEN